MKFIGFSLSIFFLSNPFIPKVPHNLKWPKIFFYFFLPRLRVALASESSLTLKNHTGLEINKFFLIIYKKPSFAFEEYSKNLKSQNFKVFACFFYLPRRVQRSAALRGALLRKNKSFWKQITWLESASKYRSFDTQQGLFLKNKIWGPIKHC